MALSGAVKNQFDSGTITIKDGTGTPLELEVRWDNGDLGVQGLVPDLRAHTAYETRGALSSLRKTGRQYPTLSFSAKVGEFSEATTGTLADMIHGTGAFAARVSTSTAIGDVTTFDVQFDLEGTDLGDGSDHQLIFEDVHLGLDFSEGDPDQFAITGTIYGDIGGDLSITEG